VAEVGLNFFFFFGGGGGLQGKKYHGLGNIMKYFESWGRGLY